MLHNARVWAQKSLVSVNPQHRFDIEGINARLVGSRRRLQEALLQQQYE